MAKSLKVGIIGAGGIAGTHIEHLKKIPGVEISAVCDVRKDAAEKTAEKWHIPHVFLNYKKLLKLKELDAVSVCTPNYFHAEPTIAALHAGKHVMVEKPMAMNPEEAQAMVDAARKAKKVLTVGYQYRFCPNAQVIKRAIDDGRLGRILYARCQALRRRGIPWWGVFGQKDLQGGGPLIDIGVHIMEAGHYLMGKPRPVSASGGCYTYIGHKRSQVHAVPEWDHKTYTVEDLAVGLIRFENGSILVVESSFAAHIEKDIFNFTIMGEKGGATFDPPTVFTDMSGTMFNMSAVPVGITDSWAAAWPIKMRDWVDSIRTGKPSMSPGEDGLAVQKMLNGIYRSAELGKEVAIK